MAKFTELGRSSEPGSKHQPSDSDPGRQRQDIVQQGLLLLGLGWVGTVDKELSGEEEAWAKRTCEDVKSRK